MDGYAVHAVIRDANWTQRQSEPSFCGFVNVCGIGGTHYHRVDGEPVHPTAWIGESSTI